jgi:hypothetical protein
MAKSVEERLAVIETQNETQSTDIEKILNEVIGISAFINAYKGKVDTLVDDKLNERLVKVETRQKIYISIGAFVLVTIASAAAFKDWLAKLIVG